MAKKHRSKKHLCQRIGNLLFQEALSDVTFVVGDTLDRYPCHKLILASGSKVFEAMLYGKLAEKSEILVTDITPSGFSLMLRYLYTDEIKIKNESEAIEAAFASKKYLLKELFQACEDYLRTNVTINLNTVFSLYEDASFLEMKGLQNQCLNYISRNAKNIFCSKIFYKAPISTLQDIFKLEFMNVESEKDIIKAVWHWGKQRCEDNGLLCTSENIRNITKDLLKYIRFLSLDSEELETVFETYQLLDECDQLATLWNIAMPRKSESVQMPNNLCGLFQKRSITNSTRLKLPMEYRYYGDMMNFSVPQQEHHIKITATEGGITIVGVIITFKPITCYSSLDRILNFEITIANETSNFNTSAKSVQKATKQNNDDQFETEFLLNDYVAFSEGDTGYLTVNMVGEGIRLMECTKKDLSQKVSNARINLAFENEEIDIILLPFKEIMCWPS